MTQSANLAGQAVSLNRRARFDYEILETFEAGLELLGPEVKSAKSGRANLTGSYGLIRGGEAWLVNANIPAFQPKNAPLDFDPTRSRRLLLRRDELRKLTGTLHEKSFSLLPLRMYLKKGLVKIELGVGRSRKAKDKREVLKKRSAMREMRNS